MSKCLSLVFVLLMGGLQSIAAWAEENDHPLISRYPGASLWKLLKADYQPFSFPTSIVDTSVKPNNYSRIEAIGDLHLATYDVSQVSSLKVYENYKAAAEKLGFKPIFECKLAACGDESQVDALGALISNTGNMYNYWRDPYYFIAEKEGVKGKIYGAWFVGSYDGNSRIQQMLLELEPLENDLITINIDYLKQQPTSTVPDENPRDADKDNPLLGRYPGARLNNYLKQDYETFVIPPATGAKAPHDGALSLVGDLTLHTYEVYNVSTLKVYENYKHALNKAGFSILSYCELDACGEERVTSELGSSISANNNVYNYWRKSYYLVAKKGIGEYELYVALYVGGYEDDVRVQQAVVKTEALENDLITVNSDGLKQALDAKGKALIYGIYFDTAKADIKAESTPTFDAIAELLTKNAELSLYVVGHTDDTGANSSNVSLSKARATSVVKKLVEDYRISAGRLQAEGVGPYAPEASNESEAGRKLNRRVELVKRLEK